MNDHEHGRRVAMLFRIKADETLDRAEDPREVLGATHRHAPLGPDSAVVDATVGPERSRRPARDPPMMR